MWLTADTVNLGLFPFRLLFLLYWLLCHLLMRARDAEKVHLGGKGEKEQRAVRRQDQPGADINRWDLSFPMSVMHFLNSSELRWQSHWPHTWLHRLFWLQSRHKTPHLIIVFWLPGGLTGHRGRRRSEKGKGRLWREDLCRIISLSFHPFLLTASLIPQMLSPPLDLNCSPVQFGCWLYLGSPPLTRIFSPFKTHLLRLLLGIQQVVHEPTA